MAASALTSLLVVNPKQVKEGCRILKKSDCYASYNNRELVLMCQGFHLSLNHVLLPQNKYHNSQAESLTTVQRSAGLANEGREMCYCNNRSLLPGCVVPSSQSWALGRSKQPVMKQRCQQHADPWRNERASAD